MIVMIHDADQDVDGVGDDRDDHQAGLFPGRDSW